MQKKLIALAVAGLASGAAFAQTNVTIYGIADAAYMYSDGDRGANRSNHNGQTTTQLQGSNTFSGIQSGQLSGSRLGFKGSEDLGNGLKAIFTLEYSLGIDGNNGVGNTGGLNARQQFVGLSSAKLGTVALGRQYAPGYLATVRNDAFGGATFAPQSLLTNQSGNTITPNSPARYNNSATYSSPNFSGFTGNLIYSFGENGVTGDTTDNGQIGVGGNYSNGPLNIDLVYQSRQDVMGTLSGVAGSGKDVNEYLIGAAYDFKMVKVFGTYQDQNDKNAGNMDNSTWSLGATVPVLAASNIHLSYAATDWDQGTNGAMWNGKNQAYGLGWTTAMSKRTTLYAGYIYIDNDKDAPGIGVNGTGGIGENNQTFLSGIRHTF